MVTSLSGVHTLIQLPDSPVSSAYSSITLELYFSVSVSSFCKDTLLHVNMKLEDVVQAKFP